MGVAHFFLYACSYTPVKNSRVYFGNEETRIVAEIATAPLLEVLLTTAPREWIPIETLAVRPMSDSEDEEEEDTKDPEGSVDIALDVLRELAVRGLPIVVADVGSE